MAKQQQRQQTSEMSGCAWPQEEREQEEQQRREAVISEFDAGDPDATMRAMAAEILDCRRGLKLLAAAAEWAEAGAPLAVVGPGPLWRLKQQTGLSESSKSSKSIDAAAASE